VLKLHGPFYLTSKIKTLLGDELANLCIENPLDIINTSQKGLSKGALIHIGRFLLTSGLALGDSITRASFHTGTAINTCIGYRVEIVTFGNCIFRTLFQTGATGRTLFRINFVHVIHLLRKIVKKICFP